MQRQLRDRMATFNCADFAQFGLGEHKFHNVPIRLLSADLLPD
jgi:hypothetical protein